MQPEKANLERLYLGHGFAMQCALGRKPHTHM